MNQHLQSLLPVITLILGYLLNVWIGSIESRRSEKRRRITDKEKAYAKISAILHELFETYRVITLNANRHRAVTSIQIGEHEIPMSHDYESDIETIGSKYDQLRMMVFEQSLYLEPKIIQALMELPLIDVQSRFASFDIDTTEMIKFEEEHVDQLWSKAKSIISEMRVELELEPYPDEILKMWR